MMSNSLHISEGKRSNLFSQPAKARLVQHQFMNSVCSQCDRCYYHIFEGNIGVFPKWSGSFIEFSEFSKFRESYKSLKHE